MLTERLLHVIIAGGSEWVMIVLIFLSIVSIGVIFERGIYFYNYQRQIKSIYHPLNEYINSSHHKKVKRIVTNKNMPTLNIAINEYEANSVLDIDVIDRKFSSALSQERLRFEKHLGFLGTLGNNAPFIGLFGTVLGIIRAFNDLSLSDGLDTSVVMAGIAEALVATAIGLFVALPAVLFFNLFQRRLDYFLSITESLAYAIITNLDSQRSK